jgi:polyisoprenoid-binding protein YceI
MATAVPDEGAAEEGAVEVDDAGDASEAAGDAMAGTVTYVIDPTRSEARYEVGETFFEDNRFNVAVGRTTGISGAVVVDTDDPGASSVEAIEVDVNQLASDSDRRDNFIRERALGSNDFPTARFVGTAISGMPENPQEGEPVTFQLSGDLTVRDVTLPVTWTVTATLAAGELNGTATTQVLMSDYGIGPIQIMQLGTEDEVDLTLDFVAVRSE